MPEVRTLPLRGTTSRYCGPLPQREHRKIALSVEGEAASLTAAAPQGMKVFVENHGCAGMYDLAQKVEAAT